MLTNPAAYTLPSGATATAMKRSCSVADIGEAAMPVVPKDVSSAALTAPAVVVGAAATVDVVGVVVSAAPSSSSSPHAASASAPTNRAPASFFKITLRS